MVEAKPHRKLAMVKPEAEIANSSRVPNARDRKPDSGIPITSAIRYEVWTHDTSDELADRPAWISASEAETIWMSRIDMNIPNTMMRNANSRRGGIRSEPQPGSSSTAGRWWRQPCLLGSGRDSSIGRAARCKQNYFGEASRSAGAPARRHGFLLRLNHPRRVEVGFAVGVRGALAVSTVT